MIGCSSVKSRSGPVVTLVMPSETDTLHAPSIRALGSPSASKSTVCSVSATAMPVSMPAIWSENM